MGKSIVRLKGFRNYFEQLKDSLPLPLAQHQNMAPFKIKIKALIPMKTGRRLIVSGASIVPLGFIWSIFLLKDFIFTRISI